MNVTALISDTAANIMMKKKVVGNLGTAVMSLNSPVVSSWVTFGEFGVNSGGFGFLW